MGRLQSPRGPPTGGSLGAQNPGSPSPLHSCALRVSPSGVLTGLLGASLCAAALCPSGLVMGSGDLGAPRGEAYAVYPVAMGGPLATSLKALVLVWWEIGLDVGE